MESGIHGVESRIQECLGFPYMGQLINFSYLSVGTYSTEVGAYLRLGA